MEKSKEQEIQELFETHENNFCFECGNCSLLSSSHRKVANQTNGSQ